MLMTAEPEIFGVCMCSRIVGLGLPPPLPGLPPPLPARDATAGWSRLNFQRGREACKATAVPSRSPKAAWAAIV
jgi:hypothetical protein